MAWPVTRSTGFVVTAAAWNEVVNALSGWGGNVNAGGHNLSNLGALSAATGAFSGAVSAGSVASSGAITGLSVSVDCATGGVSGLFSDGATSTLQIFHGMSGFGNALVLNTMGGAQFVLATGSAARMYFDSAGWVYLPNLPGYSGEIAAAAAGVPSGAIYWNTTTNSLMRKS
jgi:hypothetical protein